MTEAAESEDWVDDREIDHDPYGIVPDGFCAAWGATNIPDALAAAEEAPTSTPRGELRRCPHCQSVKVRMKKANYEIEHMRPETYRCEECGTHFDTPAAPSNEQATGKQTTLTEVQR